MTSTDEILASHRACRRLSGQAASNFPAAFCLLPPAKRQAMHALYAFMRHSDDLADDPPAGGSARELLTQWRGALEKAIAGDASRRIGFQPVMAGDSGLGNVDPQGRAMPPADYRLETYPTDRLQTHPTVDPRGCAILPAVVQTVREFKIPLESLLAVLDGVEMDIEPRVYATFDELAVYCERVASAVGLACIHVWGFTGGEKVLHASRSAGLALQLTNILRDLSEDARRERVYLPLEDINACGYSAEELQNGVVNRPFLRLMDLEFERAEQFYREAAELPRWLHKDGHRINGLMMETYHALLHAIRRHPADVFARRIRVSRWKKLWLAARWSLGPVKAK